MHQLRSFSLLAALAAALLVFAPPAARAGKIHAFTVFDDSGLGGLSDFGTLRFAELEGACFGSDCLTLLDGIQITFEDSGFMAGDTWEVPGSDVEQAFWSIDPDTWALSGGLVLVQKGDLAPLLSFDGTGGGGAVNLASEVVSSLESRPVPEPWSCS